MKKKITQVLVGFVVLFFVGIGKVEGQPILNASDVNPIIGDSIKMVKTGIHDGRIVSPPNSKGINLLWDYSYLNDSTSFYCFWKKRYPFSGFVNSAIPGQTFPQNLPNGNSITYDSYNSEYFINLDNISNSSWNYVGAYNSYPGANGFQYKDSLFKPLPYLVYPLTYGTYYLDSTSSQETYYGKYSVAKIYDTVVCEAYGTLILPHATYSKVLLVRHTLKRFNSYNYVVMFPVEVEYLFMVNGIHGPVLKISRWTTNLWGAVNYIRNIAIRLPLKLVNISAYEINKAAVINWQTATEVNTSHFILEQSSDGKTFIAKGTVKAVGSGANSYVFEVPFSSPLGDRGGSVLYYRLKMIDKDGSFNYSKIVSVQLAINHSQLTISPNLTKSSTTIHFNESFSQATISVYTVSGKLVLEKTLKTSVENYLLNTESLSEGVYLVNIKTPKSESQRKLVITK